MKVKRSAQRKLRGFVLRTIPRGSEGVALHLMEVSGAGASPTCVAAGSPANVRRVLPSVLAALKTSGHSKSALATPKAKEIRLAEEAGVRLALALLGTGPVRRWKRVDAIVKAIDAMPAEEAYYWYSNVAAEDGARKAVALRVFLAP